MSKTRVGLAILRDVFSIPAFIILFLATMAYAGVLWIVETLGVQV